MKKILIFFLTIILTLPLFAQEGEREMSDYEKYRMEKESIYYVPQGEPVCWDKVDVQPKFNGKDVGEFQKWIALNVEYPKSAVDAGVEGKVFVSFVVNVNGDVVNVKVNESVYPSLDAEAIRVVKTSPRWSPGEEKGKVVDVQFVFPISFVLDKVDDVNPMVINNYYMESDYYHRFYFDYYPRYTYYPYYGYPTYGAWYGGYYNYEAYYGYGYGYPYYSHYYYPYYGHNHYYGYNNGHRYASSSTLGWNRNYYTQQHNTYKSGYVTAPQTARTQTAQRSTQAVRPQTAQRPTNSVRTQTTRPSSARSTQPYKATYARPAANPRPEYNRSVTTQSRTVQRPQAQKSTTVRPPTQQRTTTSYSRPSSSSYQRSSTPTRSYSAPSRAPSSAPSRSYSAPSRSSGSSYSAPRSSSSSAGRSYSGGSATRSSSSGGSRR